MRRRSTGQPLAITLGTTAGPFERGGRTPTGAVLLAAAGQDEPPDPPPLVNALVPAIFGGRGDAELEAIKRAVEALDDLTDEAAGRVMTYLVARFGDGK